MPKYSINWENDEVVSVEVDGVEYASPDEIPDPKDRAQILRMMSASEDEVFDESFDKAFDKEFEEEFRQLERDTANMPKIIVGIFLTIALITLCISAITTYGTVRRLSKEQSTTGWVMEMATRQSRDSETDVLETYYYPVVEFYTPNETLQRVKLSEGSSSPGYTVGEEVTILSDPEHPTNTARIKSVSSNLLIWIGPGITGIVGIVFLGVSIFAGWFLKPNKPTI